jgi:hypothetical protein
MSIIDILKDKPRPESPYPTKPPPDCMVLLVEGLDMLDDIPRPQSPNINNPPPHSGLPPPSQHELAKGSGKPIRTTGSGGGSSSSSGGSGASGATAPPPSPSRYALQIEPSDLPVNILAKGSGKPIRTTGSGGGSSSSSGGSGGSGTTAPPPSPRRYDLQAARPKSPPYLSNPSPNILAITELKRKGSDGTKPKPDPTKPEIIPPPAKEIELSGSGKPKADPFPEGPVGPGGIGPNPGPVPYEVEVA